MANSVLSMFNDQAKSVEEHANDLNMRRARLEEVAIAWNAIKALEQVEGWQELKSLAETQIALVRAQIVDGLVENVEFARGELKALQWFIQSPSLADAHLIAVKQSYEALSADMEDFIHNGAGV